MRGSDPDASLYWLVRMLDGGADPLYLGRRIVRMAIEDVGLADPRALRLALDACETYERLGTPEGELALAEAVLYLACAAKSNAAYSAYNAAREFVAADATRPVPLHIRNAPTRLMKNLGYGKDYRYAHDEADALRGGRGLLPRRHAEVEWYRPSERGLEAKIREKLEHLRARDAEAGGKKREMIDIQLLRSNLDAVVARLAARGYDFPREQFLALEAERKDVQTRTQELQAARNAQAKRIGQAKAKGEDAGALMAESGAINAQLGELEKTLAQTQERMRQFLDVVPNLPHESVPQGTSEKDNVEQRRWGEPRAFDFAPKDHVDVGEALGMLDFETAAKLAGARFAVMRAGVARLHRSIAQFMLDVHTQEHGYTEVYVPYMVSGECANGVRAWPSSRTTCSSSRGATST